jgi:glycosyltransferase involved in cell wall biosynthesis
VNPGATIVAWQPILTDHQAYTLQSLARQSGCQVVAYVTHIEDETRKAQGWTDTPVSGVDRRLLSPRLTLWEAIRHLAQHRRDVHFFCSPFDQPVLILCLLAASWCGLEVYLVSEPYSPRADGYFSDASTLIPAMKARLRPLVYAIYGALLRKRTAGVFAISRLAVSQYRHLGVDPAKIFPFGYFVPSLDSVPKEAARQPGDSGIRLIFVGNLIRRKGLHELMAAMRQVRQRGVSASLDVYGPGDPSSFGFDDEYVRYRGQLRFGRAQEVMATYDVLVLPSRYDGWGVVVNEALCAGIPVLCSRETGASVLVERFSAGLTFPAGDISAIADVIASVAADSVALEGMREGARTARRAIQPEVAASYMLKVISSDQDDRQRIPSPWYGEQPYEDWRPRS